MRMTGGDAILRALEAEGVEVMFGIPGGAIMPTYDAMARGTTVRHVLARHEQGAGHMAQGYARASGKRRCRDRDLRPGGDEPRHPDRGRLDGLDPARLHHGPGPLDADRHRRVPGVRHHRDHDADRQALVARPGWPRPALDHARRLPRRADRTLWPRRGRRPARHPGGGRRRRAPGRARPAGLAPTDEGASTPDPRGRPCRRERAQARPVRRGRHAQRRRLRRAPRARRGRVAARRDDAHGKRRVPRGPRAPLRLAGDARPEVVEPRDQLLRCPRRDRRALRRPRDGQALRLRAGRDGRPPRRRRGRDLEAARRRHPRGRGARDGGRGAGARGRATPRRGRLRHRRRGSRRSASGARSSRSATTGTASGSSPRPSWRRCSGSPPTTT